MKKLICLMAFGLLCCALNTAPALADVTGDITSQTLDFPNGVPTVVTEYSVANTNSNTNSYTNLNNKLYVIMSPGNEYPFWNINDPKTLAPYESQPFVNHYVGNTYTYHCDHRDESWLTGLTGFPKVLTTIKNY